MALLAAITIASIPLLVLAALGLGGLLPLCGLAVWAISPRRRTHGLKWAIILATPCGLLVYWYIRWSLWGQLIMLEGCGPIDALRRSSHLVSRRWFRAAGVNMLTIALIALFGLAPIFGISAVLARAGVTIGFNDQRLFANTLTVGLATGIGLLLGPFMAIVLTVLTLSLRNAGEGSDLVERLSLIEATP